MESFYAITKCPKCGNENIVEYGYSGGFDCCFESIVETTCINKNCENPFKIDFNINEYETVKIDSNNIVLKNNNINSLDSYYQYYEELLNYAKKLLKN